MTASFSPVVSIIIPTKNRLDLLKVTIKSLLDQSYQFWEAIIVDDGSDDNTTDWLTKLGREDKRIRFFKRNGGRTGAQACRNIGVEESRGIYVMFLDSDDCLAPYAVEQRVKVLEQSNDVDFVVFQCLVFHAVPGDSDVLWNVEKNGDDIDRFLQLDVPWSIMSPLWRREALNFVGPWDESLIGWQDWEYHLRALAKGVSYCSVPFVDCYYRLSNKDRESIGSRSVEERALEQYRDLFIKVRDLLYEEGALSPIRKQLLIALYYWLSELWAKKNKAEKVREILRYGWKEDIISPGFYIFFRFYYSRVLYMFPRQRARLKRALLSQLNISSSKSFLRISISEAGLFLEEKNGSLYPVKSTNNVPDSQP